MTTTPRSSPLRRLWEWKHLKVVLFATSASFLALWIVSFPRHLDVQATGSLGQWVSAVGTTSAFMVTFLQLRRNIRERRDSDEDKLREQATAVSAWVSDVAQDASSYYTTLVVLRNGSKDPIYDVWCRSYTDDTKNGSFEDAHLPLIAPESKEQLLFETRAMSSFGDGAQPQVELTFRDTREATWLRERTGLLSRLGPTAAQAWASRATQELGPGRRCG